MPVITRFAPLASLPVGRLAIAHPGHGEAVAHVHGEIIFAAVLLGAVGVGLLLRFVARRSNRGSRARV